jgi:signal transduction histidine kinase
MRRRSLSCKIRAMIPPVTSPAEQTPSATRHTPRGVPLLLPVASVVILLGLLAGVLAGTGYLSARENVVNEAELRARAAAADVDRFVIEQFDTLRAIAAAPPVRTGDLPGMRRYFDDVADGVVGFDGGIGWIDDRGIVRALSGYAGDPVDASEREYVKEVLESGRPYVSEAIISVIEPFPLMILAVPTRDEAGRVNGLVAGGFRLDRVSAGSESLRFAGGSEVYIVDRLGQLIIGDRPVVGLEPITALPWYETARSAGSGTLTDVPGIDGAQQLVAHAEVPSAEWMVLVESSYTEAFGPARSSLLSQLLVVALVTAASLGALWIAGRRIRMAAHQRELAYSAEHEARTRAEVAVGRTEELLGQLRERESLRDAFIGVLSHELRTPVTTIYGAAKLLARSGSVADGHGLVQDIEEESDRLYRIIEDLLVLSRAERGKLEVNPEPVLLQRLVPLVIQDVQRRAPSLKLELDVPSDVPPVLADPGPLRQVVNNLVTNAAKYGGGTPVRIGLRRERSHVRLVVEDGGPGFPPEEADHLFELFYRSPSTARMAAGTGIGLYVVRQLVTAMGGWVEAFSRPGQGSRFEVVLPAAAGADEPPLHVPTGDGLLVGAEHEAGPALPA